MQPSECQSVAFLRFLVTPSPQLCFTTQANAKSLMLYLAGWLDWNENLFLGPDEASPLPGTTFLFLSVWLRLTGSFLTTRRPGPKDRRRPREESISITLPLSGGAARLTT